MKRWQKGTLIFKDSASEIFSIAAVALLCFISLLRCKYYHEYLACEQEDFCERYI